MPQDIQPSNVSPLLSMQSPLLRSALSTCEETAARASIVHSVTSGATARWCANTGCEVSARRATSASSSTSMTCPRCLSVTSTQDLVSDGVRCLLDCFCFVLSTRKQLKGKQMKARDSAKLFMFIHCYHVLLYYFYLLLFILPSQSHSNAANKLSILFF